MTFGDRAPVHVVDDVDALPVDGIRASLDESRFAIVRGLATADEVRAAMSTLRERFRPEDDHATVGESPEDVRHNFQKWSVGTGGERDTYARLIRVIFTPFLDEDRYGVQDLLRRVAKVRNLLLDLPGDFAVDRVDSDLWSAARLQQYPAGGGFIQAHVDAKAVQNRPSGAGSYVQVLMVLTERGVDFERGGAYIEGGAGRVDLEELVQLGDLLIYDEQAVHGVADIDPHRVLDTTVLSGRIAGFANLYRAL